MRRAELLLGLLGLLLAGVLAVELGAPEAGAPVGRPPATVLAAPSLAASAEPAAGRVQAQLALVLARPLFEQDRRPVAEARAGATVEGQVRLAGILISPAGRRAIFAPADGKPLVLGEGDSLGPMTVRSIAPGAVTVLRHGSEQVLRPTYAETAVPQTAVAQPGVGQGGVGQTGIGQPGIGPAGGQPGLVTLPGAQPFSLLRSQGVSGNPPRPGFTSSFAVPSAPPNLLGTAPAQPLPESRQ